MATPTHHAIVFGASGINGWALVNQLLINHPTSDTFGRVTAVLNRPLSLRDSQWPQDDRLRIATGLDLTADDTVVQNTFEAKIEEAETISHVYYVGTCGRVREDCYAV